MQSCSIAIIEDEFFFRQSLIKTINEAQNVFYVCGEAQNGQEGLVLIHSMQPDIALVDINLPLLNGIEMIRILRDEGAATRFVILSGYNEHQFIRSAFHLNVKDYLLKPVSNEDLFACLGMIRNQIQPKESKSIPFKGDTDIRKEESVQQIVDNVDVYIAQHYCEPDLCLQKIAASQFISVQYLCSIYKKKRGCTVGSTISETRLTAAYRLIRSGVGSVSYVAERCGFDDALYFSKCFKKRFGYAPSQCK